MHNGEKTNKCNLCNLTSAHAGFEDTYGSVSAGREFWPFRVIFFQKVERSCGQTVKDRFDFSIDPRGGRYVLIIHFYVELGQKLIQFNIQFKIESKIFIQKIIHSNWKNNLSLRKQ